MRTGRFHPRRLRTPLPEPSALPPTPLETIYDDFVVLAKPGRRSLVDVIDRLWAATGDRPFKAVLEAWSAAANDRNLVGDIAPAIARFAKLMSVDTPSRPGRRRNPDTTGFVLTAPEAMLGLALRRSVSGSRPLAHEARMLGHLRAQATPRDRLR